jgi:hypothetical protein
MALDDRDYMRARVRRTIDRERGSSVLSWPPKPWMTATALLVIAALLWIYVN